MHTQRQYSTTQARAHTHCTHTHLLSLAAGALGDGNHGLLEEQEVRDRVGQARDEGRVDDLPCVCVCVCVCVCAIFDVCVCYLKTWVCDSAG
jgi:hypothetical protein